MSCCCSHALTVTSQPYRIVWVLRTQIWEHLTRIWEQSIQIWEQSIQIWEDCVTIWEDSVETSEQPKLIWEDNVIIWYCAPIFEVISSTFWEDFGLFSSETRNCVAGWAYYVRSQKCMVLHLDALLPVYLLILHYAPCSQIQIVSTFYRTTLYREHRALPDLGIWFVAMPPLNHGSCNCKPCLSSLHESSIWPKTCLTPASACFVSLFLPLFCSSRCLQPRFDQRPWPWTTKRIPSAMHVEHLPPSQLQETNGFMESFCTTSAGKQKTIVERFYLKTDTLRRTKSS